MQPVGVCTWTFGPLPLEQIARGSRIWGLTGWKLLGELPLEASKVRAVLESHGLRLFSLTPANVDLAHPDPARRLEALDYYHRLLEFAAEAGCPLVSCHGAVGRFAPLATQAQEWAWLVEGVGQICSQARALGLTVVFEVLNRYETHLVNTTQEALALLSQVGQPNLKVLLDTYHMNIEEASLPTAIRQAGPHLGLFHLADSNRRGIGDGHTDFEGIWAALREVGYTGPLILEATAPGPHPFTPVKGAGYLQTLEADLSKSLRWLRARAQ